MDGFHPETSFGPDVAERYDDDLRCDEEASAAFLARHALGGALEFAIGTGRVALPLARHGVRVDGIELSPHMVARLRQKPGGDDLDVLIGDMASGTTGKTYSLVYLVFNTVYNILTQEGQVECFRNAARHLDEGGVFVVEALSVMAQVLWFKYTRRRYGAGQRDHSEDAQPPRRAGRSHRGPGRGSHPGCARSAG